MKDLTLILEGDGEEDILAHIIKVLGVEKEYEEVQEKFINDESDINPKSVVTKKVLEQNLDKILTVLNLEKNELDASDVGYLWILGYFILRTGANIPDFLRLKIAEAATPEHDFYVWKDKDVQKDREMRLKDLHDKILNHKAGQINPILEDPLNL